MQANLVIFMLSCFLLICLLTYIGSKYITKDPIIQRDGFTFKTEYLIAIGALVIFIVLFGLQL